VQSQSPKKKKRIKRKTAAGYKKERKNKMRSGVFSRLSWMG
jgi:hypothetical protein